MEKDLYFIDESSKIIFALVVLNGKLQLDFLGADYGHYCDKEEAKNWYQSIKEKLITSDHPKLNEAMESLEKIYKGMLPRK